MVSKKYLKYGNCSKLSLDKKAILNCPLKKLALIKN